MAFSNFGKSVKKRLIDIDRTQNWLIKQVIVKTGGMFFDDSYLHKILSGERTAPKIVQAICEILDLTEDPEESTAGNTEGI